MRLAIVVICAALSGCAINVVMMPRDSGKVYNGEINLSGGSSGTMTVQIEDATCTGPIATVASNNTFGLINTYAGDNRGNRVGAISTASYSGDSYLKAVLSCTNGTGLRCDVVGRNRTGGGVCVDSNGKVYDAIGTRK